MTAQIICHSCRRHLTPAEIAEGGCNHLESQRVRDALMAQLENELAQLAKAIHE